MELFFKDLEDDDAGLQSAGTQCECDEVTRADDAAEDLAFAELSERVSAARLVY